MKEKDTFEGEELERIDNKLFNAFDPDDESWMVGGSYSLTTGITHTPTGYDVIYDLDFPDIETQST